MKKRDICNVIESACFNIALSYGHKKEELELNRFELKEEIKGDTIEISLLYNKSLFFKKEHSAPFRSIEEAFDLAYRGFLFSLLKESIASLLESKPKSGLTEDVANGLGDHISKISKEFSKPYEK